MAGANENLVGVEPPSVGGASFLTHLDALTSTGDGRYRAVVDRGWGAPIYPQGGLIAALGLEALRREIGQDLTVRSATALFVEPVKEGPVEIETEVLRFGRTVSHGRVVVRNPGSAHGLTAHVALGADRPGFELAGATMPEVARPTDCESFRTHSSAAAVRGAGILQRLDLRMAQSAAPAPQPHDRVFWARFDDEPSVSDASLHPLAPLVMCDMMAGAARDLEGGGEASRWVAPSVDLTVHLLDQAPPRGWSLAVARTRRATKGYCSSDLELWDPSSETLLAFACQTSLVRFL